MKPVPSSVDAAKVLECTLGSSLRGAMQVTPAKNVCSILELGTEKSLPLSPAAPCSQSPACSALLQVAVVSAFAQTLRRYTSLNHLAQAARAVLQNTSQINQMLSDLNRVDFANVQVTYCIFSWALLSRTGAV